MTQQPKPNRLNRSERRRLRRQVEREQIKQSLLDAIGFQENQLDTFADGNLPADHPLAESSLPVPYLLRTLRLVLIPALLFLLIWPRLSTDLTDTVAAVILAAFVIFMAEARVRLQKRPRAVESIEGIVILEPRVLFSETITELALRGYSYTPDDFEISIGSQKFVVPEKVYHAFEDGRPYRIYYTTVGQTIVAAEPLLPGMSETSEDNAESQPPPASEILRTTDDSPL